MIGLFKYPITGVHAITVFCYCVLSDDFAARIREIKVLNEPIRFEEIVFFMTTWLVYTTFCIIFIHTERKEHKIVIPVPIVEYEIIRPNKNKWLVSIPARPLKMLPTKKIFYFYFHTFSS